LCALLPALFLINFYHVVAPSMSNTYQMYEYDTTPIG